MSLRARVATAGTVRVAWGGRDMKQVRLDKNARNTERIVAEARKMAAKILRHGAQLRALHRRKCPNSGLPLGPEVARAAVAFVRCLRTPS